MQIAYLIAAHHQPAHLARLVHALKSEDAWIFIHVDRKSNILAFRHYLPQAERIVYLDYDDRQTVRWSGFSVFAVTLKLLGHALRHGPRFHRYCLLSGSDYPIARNTTISDSFNRHTEYLRINCALSDRLEPGARHRFRHLHLSDWPELSRANSSESLVRPAFPGMTHYHGSAWWALTHDCVGFCMDYLRKNPEFLHYHRFTFAPDEIVFHTLIKQSPFAQNISHDFKTSSDRAGFSSSNVHGCHYIDWNARDEDERLPKVLRRSDYPAIRNSGALFARKFHQQTSATLLQRIDDDRRREG